MFKKILIANRGEIACRVIRTAKAMGIKTVAVYSDADARAPHVRMADESVRLGPAPASESYLKAELIIDACKATGAEAVHPGYGFLSERESFAKALDKAGIKFIGPPAKAIAAMGDKIQSKKLAVKAGVSVVPGFIGEITSEKHAAEIANGIGYPVMMKASAGGGGKGMRLAFSEAEVREQYDSVKREGLASFGDDRLLIEKYVEGPRHIEIQVLGDQHGTVLHLGERECSIQRRHQKVIEEAPSPFVDAGMREAMGAQAVALAKAVGYYSAGTVEMIVGADKSFYFLEMNTRLQVEHPVTEEVTGLDLVEQMIRIAAGEKLKFAQKDVKLDGWAIESRVYAEDPYRGFLPSTGRLTTYRPPVSSNDRLSRAKSRDGVSTSLDTNGVRVRVDDGVTEGGEVSMFYDPMIAKLITHAATRDGAIEAQVAALDAFQIDGVSDNIDFLSALMQHPRFRAGKLTTGFIAEEYPDGFHGAPADDELLADLAALAAIVELTVDTRAALIDGPLGDPQFPEETQIVRMGGRDFEVSVTPYDGGNLVSVDDGEEVDVIGDWAPGQRLLVADMDGRRRVVQVARKGRGWLLTTRGAAHKATVMAPHIAALMRHMIEKMPPDLSRFLLAPMPGLLTRLEVKPGDKVEAGQPVAVVEAMKMENILRAGKAGAVKSVSAGVGDSLSVDQVIVEFE